MEAWRKSIVINDPKRVTLTDLPFRSGQRVEVLIVFNEEDSKRLDRWRDLFRATQELPEARTITEGEIAAEIEAHRIAQ